MSFTRINIHINRILTLSIWFRLSLNLAIYNFLYLSLSISLSLSLTLFTTISASFYFLSNFGRSHPFALFWCVCCLQEGRMDRFHHSHRHRPESPFPCCPLISQIRRRSCITFTITTSIRIITHIRCICRHCTGPARREASLDWPAPTEPALVVAEVAVAAAELPAATAPVTMRCPITICLRRPAIPALCGAVGHAARRWPTDGTTITRIQPSARCALTARPRTVESIRYDRTCVPNILISSSSIDTCFKQVATPAGRTFSMVPMNKWS